MVTRNLIQILFVSILHHDAADAHGDDGAGDIHRAVRLQRHDVAADREYEYRQDDAVGGHQLAAGSAFDGIPNHDGGLGAGDDSDAGAVSAVPETVHRGHRTHRNKGLKRTKHACEANANASQAICFIKRQFTRPRVHMNLTREAIDKLAEIEYHVLVVGTRGSV